jgi:hypothetical protein
MQTVVGLSTVQCHESASDHRAEIRKASPFLLEIYGDPLTPETRQG